MPAGSRPHDACVRQRFQSSNRVNVGGEEVCRELEVLGVVGIVQGRFIPVNLACACPDGAATLPATDCYDGVDGSGDLRGVLAGES